MTNANQPLPDPETLSPEEQIAAIQRLREALLDPTLKALVTDMEVLWGQSLLRSYRAREIRAKRSEGRAAKAAPSAPIDDMDL